MIAQTCFPDVLRFLQVFTFSLCFISCIPYINVFKNAFFVSVEVPASITADCELGFRLNVTVKDEMCRRNITSDICSGHGTCVTASSQVIEF